MTFRERLKNEKENFITKIKEIQEQKETKDEVITEKENEVQSLNKKIQVLTEANAEKDEELSKKRVEIEAIKNEVSKIQSILDQSDKNCK